MSIIISCSISVKQHQFLKDSGLSASSLLQDSINEEIRHSQVSHERVKDLNLKIERFAEMINKYREFLESKDLIDEFIKC